MEAATLPAEQSGEPVEGGAEATRTGDNLFKYSDYVHVGAGAAECEHATDGQCKDSGHFHAWICLPNTLQHGDMQDKARAAKARRKLAMRDPESDAYAVLEAELSDLLEGDREEVVGMLADFKTREEIPEIVSSLNAEERFEDYGQHREEWRRLSEQSEEARDAEEWDRLNKIVDEYSDALREAITTAEETQAHAIRGMGEEDLREALRKRRIAGESESVSRKVFYTWMAFVCTRKAHRHDDRYFPDMNALKSAPPEAMDVIDSTMDGLERRLTRGEAAGN